jgi:hypothetical protein
MRRSRTCKEILDDLKEKRKYWNLKEEALDLTVRRTRFGSGCGPAVRHITPLMTARYCSDIGLETLRK